MSNTLMHAAMVEIHAMRGKARACDCCHPVHSRSAKNRAKYARQLKRRMRLKENNQWRREIAA